MKMALARIILCTAALVYTTAWQANAQNIVSNPGFETGDFNNGWIHSGDINGFDTVGDHASFAHSGNYYAALGSSPDSGILEQSLTTVPGRYYTLQFYLGNYFVEGGGSATSFEVFWNNVSVYLLTNPSVFNYRLVQLTVKASAGSTTPLRFVYTHASDYWYLDDVSATLLPEMTLTAAVSRKTHGAAGSFDINLLNANFGPECRNSSGNHTLVFTFTNNVVSGSASVTAGTGTISGSPSFSGNTMTVNLTGVANVQKITVTLNNVTDTLTQVMPSTAVSMNTLVGDTSGNKTVNGSDVSQTKVQVGVAVSATNFREDVNVNGSINASDVSLVKARSGAAVP
jgi:hypothetical protein